MEIIIICAVAYVGTLAALGLAALAVNATEWLGRKLWGG